MSIALLVIMSEVSHEYGGGGGPHSFELIEAYFAAEIFATFILVLAPIGFVLIYFQLAGKSASMVYWFFLAFSLCYTLIALVKTLVWLSLDDADRVDDMLRRGEAEFKNLKSFTKHFTYVEKKYNCCGILNFTDYPERIINQPSPVQARVPDHCCVVQAKDCGRNHLYNDTYKYGDARRIHIFPNSSISSSLCIDLDKTGISNDVFAHYVKAFREGKEIPGAKYGSGIKTSEHKALRPKIEKLVCEKGAAAVRDYICPIVTIVVNGTPAPKWQWCYELFLNTSLSRAVNYEALAMQSIGSIFHDGCFKYAELYVDQMAMILLIFSILFVVLISVMLPVYLHMYWNYREPQMKVRPFPFWFDRLPGEEHPPVGLGKLLDSNEPLALLEDEEIAAVLAAPLTKAEIKRKKSQPGPVPTADALRALSVRTNKTLIEAALHHHHHQGKKFSVEAGTETAGQLVSDSVPPPLTELHDQQLEEVRSRQDMRKQKMQKKK